MTDQKASLPRLKAVIWLACGILAAGAGFGWSLFSFGDQLLVSWLGGSLYFFREQDTLWLALALALLPLGAWLGARWTAIDGWLDAAARIKRPEWWLAGIVFLFSAIGTNVIHQGYGLSMDEFVIRWQSWVFLSGQVFAPVPPEWSGLTNALQPVFIFHDGLREVWSSAYLPMTSVIVAGFGLVGLGLYANAFVAGFSVVLIAMLARRIWPDEPAAAGLAALLLATSTQALFMAMTPFAMTAHLFFSLLWVNFFLRGGAWHIAAGLAGFVAVGLHQIYVHPVFIMPFMIALLWQRRWCPAAGYFVWYTAVFAFWLYWRGVWNFFDPVPGELAPRSVAEAGGLAKTILILLTNHSLLDGLFWLVNLFRFIAWQDLLLLPLFLIAISAYRTAPGLLKLLAWTIVATVLPQVILAKFQIHGWGYRYLHVALGSVVLFACYGWVCLRRQLVESEFWPTARRSMAGVMMAGLIAALPLRSAQVAGTVAPFAEAASHIGEKPADLVFVDTEDIWFGIDLVRNDPLLRNRPKVMAAGFAPPEALREICQGRTAIYVDHDALAGFGITKVPRQAELRAASRAQARQTLLDAGCTLINGAEE